MEKFLLQENATYLEALEKIDHNKRGFVIVVDEQRKALGILTDGDIRRAFIAGKRVMDIVQIDRDKHFRYLTLDNTFTDTIDIFKNEAINLLPVLDEEGRVINIITKKQMHSILLQVMKWMWQKTVSRAVRWWKRKIFLWKDVIVMKIQSNY